jgi:hypothetical protein
MLNRTRSIQMTMTAIATVVVVVCLALSVPDLSSITTPSGADSDSNPPWFPSLMAFEHYDSARTHLFKQAHFAGSFDGDNKVAVRTAPVIYPTGYNMVYLNRHEIFLYGGGYGNIPNATGAFVAKVAPETLNPIWYKQLINTAENMEWDYPGVVSLLNNGFLYLIYGYRLAKLDLQDGTVIKQVDLPTGEALPQNTSYNGFDALPDGTIIAKTLYREAGCDLQGPPALFNCPNPFNVPNSIMVSIDPTSLKVLDQVTLPGPVGGRPTTVRFQDHDYVYLTTPTTAIRYLIERGKFTLDESWNPGAIYEPNQTLGSAVVVMNDWFVVQTNSSPASVPLSVIVISQADASKQFSAQPFADFPVPSGLPKSFAPFSVSVDPTQNLIYAADSSPGVVGALKLTANGLQTVWTAHQTTTEFLALIGPRDRRVLVGTDIPPGQAPTSNTTDYMVWRNADTGQEIARTKQLPKMTTGTMIQPYYFGKMFYLGLQGDLIELNARPASEEVASPEPE